MNSRVDWESGKLRQSLGYRLRRTPAPDVEQPRSTEATAAAARIVKFSRWWFGLRASAMLPHALPASPVDVSVYFEPPFISQ